MATQIMTSFDLHALDIDYGNGFDTLTASARVGAACGKDRPYVVLSIAGKVTFYLGPQSARILRDAIDSGLAQLEATQEKAS